MTANEVTNLIEEMLTSFPERASGNEVNPMVAERLRDLALNDRQPLLEALREYLSFRVPPSQRQSTDAIPEARLWMALDIAENLGLKELKPDIESLLEAVRGGKALRPLHEKGVTRYLKCLND